MRDFAYHARVKSPSPATRLGVAFFAFYTFVGLTTPFWPLYLAYRGMNPQQVGVLMALAPWARFASNLGVGQLTQSLGQPRQLLLRLSIALVVAHAVFPVLEGFTALLLLSLVVGVLYAPLSPLLDSLALAAARRGEASYGQVRVWGSMAFIVASSLGGQWLVARSDAWILWGVLASCIAIAVTSGLVPAAHGHQAQAHVTRPPRGSLALLRRVDVRVLLLASALLHGSHAVHYAFGSQAWRSIGISDSVIGWLWAEGTVFEVVLFFFGDRVSRRISPAHLLALSGMVAVVRWSMMTVATSLVAVAVAQALHSATFGCMHLGVMAYLRERFDVHETSSAATLYAGIVSGLSLALVFPVAGWCYERWGLHAFGVMAGMALLGTIAALVLQRLYENTRPSDVVHPT